MPRTKATPAPQRVNLDASQVWPRTTSETFRRSRDRNGDLSNMTFGFPLRVNGITFQGPEGLYQAMKFPTDPDLQRRIGSCRSGMDAKKAAYAAATPIHPDWDNLRVRAMALTLAAKLEQHPKRFSAALLQTGESTIVEESTRDDFWGAKPVLQGIMQGANILGQLLTQLRQELVQSKGDAPKAARAMRESYATDRLSINKQAVTG